MGPGPSLVHPRVLEAMQRPLLGHLDPDFLALMDETQTLLRRAFRTENALTLPISGTGSAGMETVLVNLLEPGDKILVCVNGFFGGRMMEVAGRAGAEVAKIERPWGEVFDPSEVQAAIGREHPKVVAIVHGETSTGALQPIEEIARQTHDAGALLAIDTVTSLAGVPVEIDRWQVDAVYSSTQKCLSAPPGLSPVSFSPRAAEAIKNRKSKVHSWYLDMSLLQRYWGPERVYHHTAPISMVYALREALALLMEEGLEARHARHLLHHRALAAGLAALGVSYATVEGHRLPQLNCVRIPDGIDDKTVRQRLLREWQIEIGGGLGSFQGKAWRIGLMGETARAENVTLFLSALETCLCDLHHPVEPGAAVAGAEQVYQAAGQTPLAAGGAAPVPFSAAELRSYSQPLRSVSARSNGVAYSPPQLAPELSVVVPLYNEQEVLPQLHRRIVESIEAAGLRFEIVYVNDGSRDATQYLLDALRKHDSRVAVLHLSRNFGHQAAVSAGLDHARGQAVAVIDADLQDPPELVPQMVDLWRAGNDVVYAVRQKRKEGLIKRAGYFVFYRLLRMMSDIEIPLDSGDFCLLDRKVVDVLRSLPERLRFMRGLRTYAGFRQVALHYERPPRAAGAPKYSWRKLLTLAIDGLVSFSSYPLHLVTYLGIASAGAAVALTVWVLYDAFLSQTAPRGWASTVAVVLYMSAIQLICLGIMGEYVRRIFIETKGRPTYIVRAFLQSGLGAAAAPSQTSVGAAPTPAPPVSSHAGGQTQPVA
jgi:alanine-glyoxylate transaminase/serine-glyoxylate transaminase/serine-pyruvate transaminase